MVRTEGSGESGENSETRVLLEEIRRDVRVIAEGHMGLDQKLDRFQQEWQQDIRHLDQRHDLTARTLMKKIQSGEKRLGQRMGQLSQRIGQLSQQMEAGFSGLSRQLQEHLSIHG